MDELKGFSTKYDVLDAIRRWPGIYLGGADADWVKGTMMARLQVWLTALSLMPLEDGVPPLFEFSRWLAVRCPDISDSNNAAFLQLEQLHNHEDSGFHALFKYLDEYRSTYPTRTHLYRGTYAPKFTYADGRKPDLPTQLYLGRFEPSEVSYWEEELQDGTCNRSCPFFATAAAARTDARARWGLDRTRWPELGAAQPAAEDG